MGASSDREPAFSPWRAGLKAARLNLIPGVILQIASLGLLVAYYTNENLRTGLSVVEMWKARGGFAFSAAGGAIFCGLLPWVFRMSLPSLRPQRPMAELIFGLIWWALMLMLSDAFYRSQTLAWGAGTDGGTIIIKVLVDMFIYTPFLASPLNSLSHYWKAKSFPRGPLRLPRHWYRRIVMPNLIPNWVVWIPGTAVVYSLPPMLQLPVANLIGCFWALLCISIAANDSTEEVAPAH